MQLVKSYLLISQHVAIVLLIAEESTTKICRLDITTITRHCMNNFLVHVNGDAMADLYNLW